MKRIYLSTIVAAVAGVAVVSRCGNDNTAPDCSWAQWGRNPAHTGAACAAGQPLSQSLARIVFDPFTAQEQAENFDTLVVHYQSPLVAGNDLFMLVKQGTYVSCDPPGSGTLLDGGTACGSNVWSTQIWTEKRFEWQGNQLVERWAYPSDWKPPPVDIAVWEPQFQPAISGNSIYVPGAAGSIWKLDRQTGAVQSQIQPFGTDPSFFAVGGVAADGKGSVYYSAIQFNLANIASDASGWLLKIAANDVVTKVTYQSIVPNAPAPNAVCNYPYVPSATVRRPFPPVGPNGAALAPPTGPCTTQRPGINGSPAIAADGTVYTVSRAHANPRYSFVVAVNPDLTPKWATSLRNFLNDGCGVLIPADADATGHLPDGGVDFGHCRAGTAVGVDPATNDKPAGQLTDLSSSAAVAVPDGVLYGSFTGYNNARGHLFKLDNKGTIVNTYDFGWDETPAVYPHDGTYSLAVKDNEYFHWDGSPPRFFITRLDANLRPEWKFQSTNTLSCARQPDGGPNCVSDHPNGFEWCINAPAVDTAGITYGNSEDGNVYALLPDGGVRDKMFLKLALGAAYTPIVVDGSGRIYSLNGGELNAIGK